MQILITLNFLFQKLFFFLQATGADDEEFNLFLFTILLLGIAFICVSVLVVIMLTMISLLVIFGFIGIGALSASVLIGINKKSFTTGFRVFVTLFSTFAMGLLGTLFFWFLNTLLKRVTESTAIISGLSFGLISGLIAGLILAFLIKKVSTALKIRIENKK